MRKISTIIATILTLALPCTTLAAGVMHNASETPHPSARTVREHARNTDNRARHPSIIRSVALDGTYANPEFGVQIAYPSLWQQNDLLQRTPPLTLVVMFLSPMGNDGGLRENVNLVTEDLPGDMTLDDYTGLGLKNEQDLFPGFSLLAEGAVSVAGLNRGHMIRFSAPLKDRTMTFEQIWTVVGRRAYVWTFADDAQTFAQNLATFERMMGTLIMR